MRLILPPLPTPRDIVKIYKLRATKQLSQNFLFNDNLLNKLVKQAGNLKNSHVIEVGPGPGGITRNILKKFPKRLTVIEQDRRFEPVLEMLADSFSVVNGKMDIIFNDVLLTDMNQFYDEELKKDWNDDCPNVHIIGNLPFNISTPLIIKWFHAISERKSLWSMGRAKMTLTFQKEVAERLVSPVKGPERCRLSVMAQAWTDPQLKFIIPGKCFVPAPNVDVGVVTFEPLKKPRALTEFKLFEKITRHIFGFRQKYCVKGIMTLIPPEHHKTLAPMMCKLADVNPQSRAIHLSVEEFDRLCSAYKYLCEKHPEIALYDYRASKHILPEKMLDNLNIIDIDDDELEDRRKPIKQ